MYYQQLVAESKRLEAQIKQLQTELSRYPEGKLISSKYRNYINWYQKVGKTKYISPKVIPTL